MNDRGGLNQCLTAQEQVIVRVLQLHQQSWEREALLTELSRGRASLSATTRSPSTFVICERRVTRPSAGTFTHSGIRGDPADLLEPPTMDSVCESNP